MTHIFLGVAMKIAVIGSRTLIIDNIDRYIPENTDELVSGGAKGIDTCVKSYADLKNIPITEFKPDYKKYGRYAPLKRNIDIINYSDLVIAIWDGKSHGTLHVIENCGLKNKKLILYIINHA